MTNFYVYRNDVNVLESIMYNISQCSGFESKLSECVWMPQSDLSLTCTSGIVHLKCCK